MDTSMANFPDISDTGVIIKLIDVVSFTLVFSAGMFKKTKIEASEFRKIEL